MPSRYRRITCRYVSQDVAQVEQHLHVDWSRGVSHSFAPAPEWRPNTDVYETASGLVVKVELAGMREEGIAVTLFDHRLLISGRREPDRKGTPAQRFHEACIRYGCFQTEVFLPFPVDRDRVTAQYSRGFLQVSLPKRQPAEQKGEARR